MSECDEYLAKYQKCIDKHVPSDRRASFQQNLDRMRAAWIAMAKNPGTRPGVGQACSLALETARLSTQSYDCNW